jgi:hypothetical protein
MQGHQGSRYNTPLGPECDTQTSQRIEAGYGVWGGLWADVVVLWVRSRGSLLHIHIHVYHSSLSTDD